MDTYQKIFEKRLQEASEKAKNTLSEDKIKDFLDSTASDFIYETIHIVLQCKKMIIFKLGNISTTVPKPTHS